MPKVRRKTNTKLPCIRCRGLIRRWIQEAVNTALDSETTAEAAQSDRCFGEHAAKCPKAQSDSIKRVASARAMLRLIGEPKRITRDVALLSDFDDFFPAPSKCGGCDDEHQ